MKLSFYPRPGHCVHWPGLKAVGQAVAYVGREFAAGDPEQGVAARHPASKEPACADSESDVGRRLAKLCRRDDALIPADAATAAFCGKEFVAVKLVDGEYVVAAKKGSE